MSIAFRKKKCPLILPNAMQCLEPPKRAGGTFQRKARQKMCRAAVSTLRPGRPYFFFLLVRTYLGQALAFLGPSPRRRRSLLRFLRDRGRRTPEVATPTALLGVLPPAATFLLPHLPSNSHQLLLPPTVSPWAKPWPSLS